MWIVEWYILFTFGIIMTVLKLIAAHNTSQNIFNEIVTSHNLLSLFLSTHHCITSYYQSKSTTTSPGIDYSSTVMLFFFYFKFISSIIITQVLYEYTYTVGSKHTLEVGYTCKLCFPIKRLSYS